MKLAYRLWKSETPSNSKLVMLHGLGGTGSLWRPIAASLESDISILAPDQRGHGGSRNAVGGYAPPDSARDLIETLSSLNFHPTWVLGHSMGVRSACALAHLQPNWVEGLILVDLGLSGPAGGGMGNDLAQFLRLLPESFPSRSAARAFMESHCPDPSIAQYLMAVSTMAPSGALTFPFDHDALIQIIEAAGQTSVRDWVLEFARAGKPVLILRGAKSLVFSSESFQKEREFFRDLPSVQFEEVEGTGHGLPFERRGWFVERIRKFISNVDHA